METICEDHPELKHGEIWLYNATMKEYCRIAYLSKRKGELPLDENGNKIDEDGLFPIFCSRQEHETFQKLFPSKPIEILKEKINE